MVDLITLEVLLGDTVPVIVRASMLRAALRIGEAYEKPSSPRPEPFTARKLLQVFPPADLVKHIRLPVLYRVVKQVAVKNQWLRTDIDVTEGANEEDARAIGTPPPMAPAEAAATDDGVSALQLASIPPAPAVPAEAEEVVQEVESAALESIPPPPNNPGEETAARGAQETDADAVALGDELDQQFDRIQSSAPGTAEPQNDDEMVVLDDLNDLHERAPSPAEPPPPLPKP